ncbi:hypothetical protein ACQEVC_34305 [Plantactinospora sp. CA-294935]|uniref:hypothetical protein n=1 Tax=Plantactinospora sp. CA-294935 TaxID=3240012 RepID=UPI003D8B9E55
MASQRLGRGLRDQLRVHQVFAERHYWERLRSPGLVLPAATPVCDDPVPNPPALSELHCPICALKKPFEEFSVEHGPQRGGQSRLGADVVAVLTCRACNNGSGRGYEAEAASIAPVNEPAEFTEEERAHLHRRRVELEKIVGFEVSVLPMAFLLTDLKAAFTVAFATLGYRFALAPELRDIRQAITKGTEPDPARMQMIHFREGSPVTGGIVLEVAAPAPCIIVASSTGTGVVLPMPGAAVIPPPMSLTHLVARRYEWPETAAHAKVNEVARAYRLGTLFHGDLCHRHQFPTDMAIIRPCSTK